VPQHLRQSMTGIFCFPNLAEKSETRSFKEFKVYIPSNFWIETSQQTTWENQFSIFCFRLSELIFSHTNMLWLKTEK